MKSAFFQLCFSKILFTLAFALIVLVVVDASAQYALANYPETCYDFTEPSSKEVKSVSNQTSKYGFFYAELEVDKEPQMKLEDWMLDEKLEQSCFYLKNIKNDQESEMYIEQWMLDNL